MFGVEAIIGILMVLYYLCGIDQIQIIDCVCVFFLETKFIS